MATCDMIHTVDDASFGYWDTEKWGDSPVHEFRCDDPNTVVAVKDPLDGTVYEFCADCAKWGL